MVGINTIGFYFFCGGINPIKGVRFNEVKSAEILTPAGLRSVRLISASLAFKIHADKVEK